MYLPINLEIYTAAFSGALAGMGNFNRQNSDSVPGDYTPNPQIADAWARAYDVAADNVGTADEVEVELAFLGSYGFFANRQPLQSGTAFTAATNPATWSAACLAMVAQTTAAETYLASIEITPNAWGGGGGVTLPLPSAAGQALQSNAAGGPLSTTSFWGVYPPAVFTITGFAKTNASLFEVGDSDVSPHFTSTYNLPATSGSIVYTQQPGSPLVLAGPYTAGTIVETFTSAVNAATASFTLHASDGVTPRTSTLTDTWAYGFLSDIVATGSIAVTQGFLDTMRADNGIQLHTTRTGTYLNGDTVGAGQISVIATPTALGTPTFTDLLTGFAVTPTLQGTVAGYMNPFGTVVSMDIYTIGGVGVGSVKWGVS